MSHKQNDFGLVSSIFVNEVLLASSKQHKNTTIKKTTELFIAEEFSDDFYRIFQIHRMHRASYHTTLLYSMSTSIL